MKKRKASVFLALLLAMVMLCSACSPSNSNTSQTPADASQDLNPRFPHHSPPAGRKYTMRSIGHLPPPQREA